MFSDHSASIPERDFSVLDNDSAQQWSLVTINSKFGTDRRMLCMWDFVTEFIRTYLCGSGSLKSTYVFLIFSVS